MAPLPLDRLRDLTTPTGQEDLLTVSYPTPRIGVGAKQGRIAAGLLAGLAVAVVGWFFMTSPGEEPIDTALVSSAGASLSAGTSPPASGEEAVVVSVIGHVENPGLVTLAPGDRIFHALEQARPLPDADFHALNQARKLVDGEQIVVYRVGEAPVEPAAPRGEPAPGGGSGGGGGGGISLNTATAAELETLKGVGAATAQAIITYREQNGGFRTVDDLLNVSGIGPAKFAAIKDSVTL